MFNSHAKYYTVCLKKTEPLQLIWHNKFTTFTNYFLHREILFNSTLTMVKFLNWRRTSCVVSITTVATWHTWTADFWGDFEQRYHRQGNKPVAKRLWGSVNTERQHSNKCCNFWYRETFYYSDRNTVFSVHKAA